MPNTATGIRNMPNLSAELVNKLDELYPKRFPDMSWSDRQVWYRAGQRSVVDHLLQVHAEQNETIISSTKD